MASKQKHSTRSAEPEEIKRGEDFAQDFEDVALPEGGSEISGDIVGYWDYKKSAIRCIPRSVKMFDGNIEPNKVSCLVMVELTQPCLVYTKEDSESEPVLVRAPIGQTVGIWYKPGMRAIVNKEGIDCYIKRNPEKDKITNNMKTVKDPNPMKAFLVIAGPGGTKIPIIEDARNESAFKVKNGEVVPVLTAFHDRSPGAQRKPKPKTPALPDVEETDEDDDLMDDSDVQ